MTTTSILYSILPFLLLLLFISFFFSSLFDLIGQGTGASCHVFSSEGHVFFQLCKCYLIHNYDQLQIKSLLNGKRCYVELQGILMKILWLK